MSIELLIRHGSPDWWESPDISVVPGTNPTGTPGTPIAGNPAYLWATVTNDGDDDATQVQVDFWIANPSLQIRKSNSNHIGTSFVDVAAGTAQAVLCLVPWNVTLVNGGHECVVVEASSPADPLSPPPADPDILDADTYPQIAQRNLSVGSVTGHERHEVIISVSAGPRSDKMAEVVLQTGGQLSTDVLESLGLRVNRRVGKKKIAATLSDRSLCGVAELEERDSMRMDIPSGTSAAVYLTVATREPLSVDEYALIRVVELDDGRAIGGLSVVVVDEDQKGGGGR